MINTHEPAILNLTLKSRSYDEIYVRGQVLGHSSSRSDTHISPDQHEQSEDDILYASKGVRCSACRWFEIMIVRPTEVTEDVEAKYLVHTLGRTTVPGEIEYVRDAWTDSAFEVVELLVVRKNDKPYIPVSSKRALAQAADFDESLMRAYTMRVGTL